MDKFMIETEHHLIFPYMGVIWSKRKKKVIEYKTKQGYIQFKINGKKYWGHRYIYEEFHGIKLKADEYINHINLIKNDNRISNLEVVNNQQNCQWINKNIKNTSGVKGISWKKDKNKWRAKIMHNKKTIHLGYFENILDAKNAWNKYAQYLNENFDCKYKLND